MPLRSIVFAAASAVSSGWLLPAALRAQQPTPSAAQGADVSGRVVDQSTGAGISSVRIVFASSGRDDTWSDVSDSTGAFAVGRVPLGEYELRAEALGYSELSYTIRFAERGSTEVFIELVPVALELEPIVVTATHPAWLAEAGFYERRARAIGYSMTRAEIEGRNPHVVSDLFYGIPGADVISERTGQTPAYVVLRGRCVPQVVLDGAPFSQPIPIDQVLAVEDLEAVEVYQGSTGPVRYSTDSCGTIMLWSKRIAPDQGRPLSWKRFLGAVGIVAWFALSLTL